MSLLGSTCAFKLIKFIYSLSMTPTISLCNVSFEQLSLKELQEINEEGGLSDNKDPEEDHQACIIILHFLQMKFVTDSHVRNKSFYCH